MTPLKQTISGDNGNCLQTAVASILDLPLEEVPHFVPFGRNWNKALVMFMQEKGYEYHGLADKQFINSPFYTKGIDGYVIAAGESPRGLQHAVIYKDGELVHDPHPDGGGVKLEYFFMFEPFTDKTQELDW